MKPIPIVVAGLLGAVAGVIAGATLFVPKDREGKLEAENTDLRDRLARAETAPREAKSATLETERYRKVVEAELAATKEALAEAKKKIEEISAAPPATAGAAGMGEGTAKVVAAGKARFAFKEFEDALGDVDWTAVGTNMGAMVPLIGRLAGSLSKGEKMSPETIGNIQRFNGPLITVAMKLLEKRLPGTDANGAFTHPSFMANAIAATLEAAKLPLSESQAAALDRVGREWLDADARRLAGYGDRTFDLQKIVDECELKDRFFEAAFAILTQEQRDALSPAAVRGRVQLDLFSSGLVWAGHMRPVMFHDRDALVAQVEPMATGLLKLDDAKRLEARAVLQDWANGLPREWMEEPPDPLSRQGMVFASRVADAARRQVALLARLVDALRLDDATAAKARSAATAWVPIHVTE